MFLRSLYGWMCAGLGITALVAFYVAQSPTLIRAIAGNPVFYCGLMFAQLGLVFFLSARVEKIAAGTASLLFVLYSALTGVTFAFILLASTGESIATTFMIALDVRALALRDDHQPGLAGGNFLFMGLIGVVWHRSLESSGRTTRSSSSSASSASSCSPGSPRTTRSA
jgi:FtsH-binding integral membrane protein